MTFGALLAVAPARAAGSAVADPPVVASLDVTGTGDCAGRAEVVKLVARRSTRIRFDDGAGAGPALRVAVDATAPHAVAATPLDRVARRGGVRTPPERADVHRNGRRDRAGHRSGARSRRRGARADRRARASRRPAAADGSGAAGHTRPPAAGARAARRDARAAFASATAARPTIRRAGPVTARARAHAARRGGPRRAATRGPARAPAGVPLGRRRRIRIASGPAPALMPGLALVAGWERDTASVLSWKVELVAAHHARDASTFDGTGRFTLDLVTLHLCPLRAGSSIVRGRLCASASAGRTFAEGTDILVVRTRSRPFVGVGGAASLAVSPHPRVEVTRQRRPTSRPDPRSLRLRVERLL